MDKAWGGDRAYEQQIMKGIAKAYESSYVFIYVIFVNIIALITSCEVHISKMTSY